MCGIVGILRFDGAPVEEELLRAMATQVRHRGPDGEGFRVWPRVGFGHVRLAVIDPSGSPQPMTSVNGPMHVTFNGEIFNYHEVRADLERLRSK